MSKFLAVSLLGCATLSLHLPAASGQEWFDAARVFPETSIGAIRAVPDLDADGDRDLVWLSPTTIRADFNAGAHEFIPGPVTTGGAPYFAASALGWPYLRVGDVNGDGRADVVGMVDQPYPHAVLKILFGLPGGSFAAPIVVDLTDPPPSSSFFGWARGIALGNVDADPALEIAEAHDMSVVTGTSSNYSTHVTWWDWNGSTFAPSAPAVLPGGASPASAIEPFDCDGDGDSDLVVAGPIGTGAELRAFVLTTVGGTPTPGPVLVLPGPFRDLDAGDVDGDGDADFTTFEFEPSFGNPPTSLRLRTFSNTGSGFVAQVASVAVEAVQFGGGFIYDAQAGFSDIEGDGDLDAVFGFERMAILLNDGAGGFSLGSFVTMEHDSDYALVHGVAEDMDGDGLVDLVGSRSIRYGDGTPPHDPPGFETSVSGQFGEWEGDGDVDVLGRLGDIAMNDGSGHFTALPKQFPPPLPGTGKSFARINAAGDFSGDGDLDFMVMTFLNTGPFQLTYAGLTFMEDTGSGFCGSFGVVIPPAVYPDLDTYEGIFRDGVDYDNDGDLDIAVKDGVVTNSGDGLGWTFVPGGFTSTDVVDHGDFDQDGWVDLLSRTDAGTTSRRTLHRQTAPLAFGTADLIVTGLDEVDHLARFLDLDGDGDLDAGAPAIEGTATAFLVENVNGAAGPAIPFGALDLGNSTSLDAADVDGDGLLDLAIGRTPVGSGSSDSLYALAVHRRTGPGFLDYAPPRHYLTGAIAGLLDLDEDGDQDAVGGLPFRGLLYQGAADGIVRQYGQGTAGSGGAIPVLGANGPVRVGSTTARLTIRRGLGGAAAVLFVGLSEAAINGVVPGTAFYVLPPVIVVPFVLPGAAGAVGKGVLDLDVTGFLPGVAGLAVYHQLIVADPAGPGGRAASAGLEIRYGF